VVVVPAGLFARGMTKDLRGNLGAAMFGLVFWEGLKIGVTVVMLVIATRVVPGLNWPVLLVTMLVCMQMNWLALLWRGRIGNVESR
ncbi:MAG: ATP synthase subunit I, partial [Burkholderiaceae bacterium]